MAWGFRHGRVVAAVLGACLAQAVVTPFGWGRPAGLLWLRSLISPRLIALSDDSLRLQLRGLWGLMHAMAYLLLPLLVARCLGLGRVALGLQRDPGERADWTIWRSGRWTLAAFVLVVVPTLSAVVLAPILSQAYPMYPPPLPVRVAPGAWLCALGFMAIHLFSIEFFFRGFLPAVLRPAVGLRWAHAIALLPYVATHTFWPEAVAALPFGLLMIGLRLRTGSIWAGYVVHLLLATSLEVLGLALHGGFASPGS
jgi:membrane protease YdiL (CAAX protease family)